MLQHQESTQNGFSWLTPIVRQAACLYSHTVDVARVSASIREILYANEGLFAPIMAQPLIQMIVFVPITDLLLALAAYLVAFT
jgi:hypothetical protein